MTQDVEAKPESDRELVLTRFIEAPPAAVFRAWTEAALLARWFAPAPLTTPTCEVDPRVGGLIRTVMRTPDGTEYANSGVILEIAAPHRLVFTDAYVRAWEPSAKPFMTVEVTCADEGQGTRYTARVRHWTVADRDAHEAMGFHQGWALCADQLAEVARGL